MRPYKALIILCCAVNYAETAREKGSDGQVKAGAARCPMPASAFNLAIAIAIATAAALIFVPRVFLDRITDGAWVPSGLLKEAIAAMTFTLIYFFTG